MSVEIRTTLHGNIDFSPLNRELLIPIDISRISDLVDIELQLYCSPTVIPLTESASLTGGEDFRFYVNEHNVTNALIKELAKSLMENDHDSLKRAYLNGATAYINYSKAIKPFDEHLDSDWEYAQTYAEDENWAAKFVSLGDRNVGWSGNLHCLNFLYRFIPLSPISVQAVWRRHLVSSSITQPDELSKLSHLVCSFSQGGAPSFDSFDPTQTIPGGRLVYQMELLHKNPLEQRLRETVVKLDNIGKRLESQRVDYLTPIKTCVETAAKDILLGNRETKGSLDQLTKAVSEIG